MSAIMRGLLAASRRWWLVLLIVGLNMVNFIILFGLEAQFEALTGLPTFDTQNDLTRTAMLEQIPSYTGEALNAYLLFEAYDFVFPLIAGLMVAVLLTVFLRLNQWALTQRLLAWGLPAAALLGTLWDWLENVGMLGALSTSGAGFWVEWALLFKGFKLIWLSLSGVTLLLTLLLLAAYSVSVMVRSRRVRPA